MRAFAILSRFAAITLVLTVPLQPPFSNTTTLPTHYGLLVFPQFQALDVFGPLDVLNTLSMLYGNSTTMYLSIFSKTLEPVSTASKATHVNGNFGQSIVPTTTFAEHLAVGTSSDPRGDIEVLIVPGGMGTRQNMTEEVGFVKAVYPKVNSSPVGTLFFFAIAEFNCPLLQLKYIISVCTGATLLSRASILDNRRATTNKRSWAWAISTGPNVIWVPEARWVEDGNIFSSSGISAGIDVMYAWVARVYGNDVAEYLSLVSEYQREMDANHDIFGGVWGVSGAT